VSRDVFFDLAGMDDGDDFVGLVGTLERFDWVLGRRNPSGKRV
jgi:hypothetical protein